MNELEFDIKISKLLLREQHLSENCVLNRLWGPILISHQGKLEAAWFPHPGYGDVQLAVSKGLRPHPQSHMA